MKKTSRLIGGMLSEDDWIIHDFDDNEKLIEFIKEYPVWDISCVDVAANNGVAIAERIHKNNDSAFIILIANPDISPVTYLKPTIMPGSLLLRPVNENEISSVFGEAIREYLKKLTPQNDSCFVVSNRDGKQLIRYDQINFFEASEKKVIVNTDHMEYSFYDTLDNLEQRLPEGFMRCHRSFITAKSKIKKISLSKNLIMLENGYEVPVSRTYKSDMKEYSALMKK